MSLLENLLAPGITAKLGWMLVHFVWQAAVVAMLLAVVLRLLRKSSAPVRYVTACSAIVLIVVLPAVTMQLIEATGPAAEAGPPPTMSSPDATSPEVPIQIVDRMPASSDPADPLETADLTVPLAWHERIASALEPALPYLVLGWLLGVFGLSAWHLGGWMQLQRLKRRMVHEVGPALQQRLAQLSELLAVRRAVLLLESALVEVPTVVGWLRPVILLPASTLTGLTPEQLEAVLAHELAHIRRYDYLVNILQTLVEILGFYHPAVWWVSHRIRVERENCCDDLAVRVCGDCVRYARALTSLEEARHSRAELAVAATGGSLIDRIARLLGRPATDDRRFAWLPGLIALLLVAAVVIPTALTLATSTPRPPQSAANDPAALASQEQDRTEPNAPRVSLRTTGTETPNMQDDDAIQVLLDVTIAEANDVTRLDFETAVQIENILGRPIRSPGWHVAPGERLNLTAGALLQQHVVGQFLPGEAVRPLIDLLSSRGYVKVMSKPQLMALDGEESQIKVVTDEYRRVVDGSPASAYTEKIEAGVKVHLTPRIIDPNTVTIETETEVTTFRQPPSDTNSPVVIRQTATTAFTASRGQCFTLPMMRGPNPASGPRSFLTMITPHIIAQPGASQSAAGYRQRARASDAPSAQEALAGPGATTDRQPATVTATDPNVQQALLEIRTVVLRSGDPQGKGVSNRHVLVQAGQEARIVAFGPQQFPLDSPGTEEAAAPTARQQSGVVLSLTPQKIDGETVTFDIVVQIAYLVKPPQGGGPPILNRRTATGSCAVHYGGTVAALGLTDNPAGQEGEPAREIAVFVTAHPAPDANAPGEPNTPTSGAAVPRPTAVRPQQMRLEVRTVRMDRDALLNLGIQWSQATIQGGGPPWPSGVKMSVGSSDRESTKSLLAALELLQRNNQATISSQQVLAQEGRQSQIRNLRKEWFGSIPEKIETGTIVSVTPHIGGTGDITLEVTVEVSSPIRQGRRGQGTDLPIMTRRTTSNTVTIRDGGTVALAGLTDNLAGQEGEPPGEIAVFVTAYLGDGQSQGATTSPEQAATARQDVNDHPRIRVLNEEIARLEVQLVKARSVMMDNHPQVAAMKSQIEALEERVAELRNESGPQSDKAPASADQAGSQAWTIMRQWNCPPLLLGLTPQLAKVLARSRRDDPVWREASNGGTLRLRVDVEGGLPGEVVVGLFKDAAWLAEPVAVRRLSGAGVHTLTGLPVGQYQIGAMIGEPPVPVALGVHRTWPQAVEIRQGQTTTAELLMSEAFQKWASDAPYEETANDYLGRWDDLDETNLLQGQLTGPDGRPIPFGQVMIREHNPGANRTAIADQGTNEQGVYKCDEMDWPYRVSAVWRQAIPSALGYRTQTVYSGRVLEGPQKLDFRFEPFPEGTAKVAGRVIDQNGRPVKGFFLRVILPPFDDLDLSNLTGGYKTQVAYEVPFISEDGRFELSGLPAGRATVRLVPFEIQRYQGERGKEIVLETGKTADAEFQLIGKEVFYGRILFEDKTPAVVTPAPWGGATTRVLVPSGGRARGLAEVDSDGYFTAYLDDSETEALALGNSRLIVDVPTDQQGRHQTAGEFPYEKLSSDKNKAGTVTVKRPEPTPVLPPQLRHGAPLPPEWRLDYKAWTGASRRATQVSVLLRPETSGSQNDHSPGEERFELYGPDAKLVQDFGLRSGFILDKAQQYILISRRDGPAAANDWQVHRGPFTLDLSRPGRYTLTIPAPSTTVIETRGSR